MRCNFALAKMSVRLCGAVWPSRARAKIAPSRVGRLGYFVRANKAITAATTSANTATTDGKCVALGTELCSSLGRIFRQIAIRWGVGPTRRYFTKPVFFLGGDQEKWGLPEAG